MYRDEEQREFARKLRKELTDAEKSLWHFLRGNKLGVKFRRQAAIGAYVVDFVCFSHQLIVELDGPQHVSAEGKSVMKGALLSSSRVAIVSFAFAIRS
jgi:very-short-patch-repair endonuclease